MKPKIFRTSDRPKFRDLDPHGIVNNEIYPGYFIDHRMTALRENLGWDYDTMKTLPVYFFLKEFRVKYLRPLIGDTLFQVESQVVEFNKQDVDIICELKIGDKVFSTCKMIATAIDPKTNRSTDWPEDIVSLFYEDSDA